MKTIDWTKPLQVAGTGRTATFRGEVRTSSQYCKLIGLANDGGPEALHLVNADGIGEHGTIVNAPEKVTVWLNVYPTGAGGYEGVAHNTKGMADDCAGNGRRIGEAREVEIEL